MNTDYIGAHAESQFTAFALENGWEVAHPYIKTAPYDSLIRRSPDSPWETVQVKRAYYVTKSAKNKNLEVRLHRGLGPTRRPYKTGDFDWLFCYHEDGRWFMPWDLLKRKRSSVQVGSPRYDLWRV